MKRFWKQIAALGIGFSLLGSTVAYAAHPAGYWPYLTAFQNAQQSGDKEALVSTGEALLQYYQGLPMDTDTAGIRYNVYYNTYSIYESMGKMEKAKEALRGVIETGNYLNFTDAVIMAEERLRKIEPKAEVYAVSTTTPAPYYGAKHEPKSGTWYGRCYTEAGESAIADASIVSFYVELGSGQNSAKDYGWKIEEFDTGNRAILINLNFPNEGNTVSQVNAGSLDKEINETLSYLATLKGPVLLRIGAEMNVWNTKTTPEAFKTAYTRIATMARNTAPNAALIFSTNCASPWGESDTMESFFPDPSVVDWVGISLYLNKYQFANNPVSAGDTNDMYFGLGAYADAVKNAEHTIDLAKKYNKPVIVTESGSGYALPQGGEDLSAFSANRLTELYSTLNMVYPQVKAIVHFDKNMGNYSYALNGNGTVQGAYQKAISENPTFISSVGKTAPSFVTLENAKGLSGVVSIKAYCDVINQGVTVTYTLDGSQKAAPQAMPFAFSLDTGTLSAGAHTLDVTFKASNGYTTTKSYTVTKDASGTVSFAKK